MVKETLTLKRLDTLTVPEFQELAVKLIKIFSQTRFFEGQVISPFTDPKQIAEDGKKRDDRINLQVQEAHLDGKRLSQLAAEVGSIGGITQKIYQTFKYEINTLARAIANARWWGGGGLDQYSYAEEDDTAKPATEFMINRFQVDGHFDRQPRPHPNLFRGEIQPPSVFDTPDTFANIQEGTFFQVEFEGVSAQESVINRFRIFHQGHRNHLQVATVDLDLLEHVLKVLPGEVSTPRELLPSFTMSNEECQALIDDFNQQYGKYLQVKVDIKSGNIFIQIPNSRDFFTSQVIQQYYKNHLAEFGETDDFIFDLHTYDPGYRWKSIKAMMKNSTGEEVLIEAITQDSCKLKCDTHAGHYPNFASYVIQLYLAQFISK